MKIVFISNYINHHQIPLCHALYKKLGDQFYFIQTEEMEAERIAMGWHQESANLPYVKLLYREESVCRDLIRDCDVLLAGWTSREDLIRERLMAGKPVIRISERLYREGQWKAISPRGLIQKYKDHTKYRNQKAYLLCAGAYVASDFHLVRAYPDKMFQWGYFPETKQYTKEELIQLKPQDGTLHIVFAGRFIPLKHPEFMTRLAASLMEQKKNWDESVPFHDFMIHMAGSGEMEEELKKQASELGVLEHMKFYGFLPPEQVRDIMEKCHIHIFTSNHLEGWGAVINEAMNSGCVEVANIEAGAVPFLIDHKKNGMIYRSGRYEDMLSCVAYLITHDSERRNMSIAAYHTIADLWNAEHAAGELLRFCEELLIGDPNPAMEGPLSKAKVIAPRRMEDEVFG